MSQKGVVAAGHIETARAAEQVLEAGGNAFDAVIAAQLVACVVEPVLTSLGGGGFMLAESNQTGAVVYDFFVQTPTRPRPAQEIDFHPISADFGTAQQEFHIGLGAIATPGTVKGLFAIHRDLSTMPMPELMAPAIRLAREGVGVNALQAYIFQVVSPIYLATSEAVSIYGSRQNDGLLGEGETLKQPDLAQSLELLAAEGESLFYHGELARLISECCRSQGGHLTYDDLDTYRVVKRKPLAVTYRDATILTNPPPSSGGILVAFALKLLEAIDLKQYAIGQNDYLELLAMVMELTNKARLESIIAANDKEILRILDQDYLNHYRREIIHRPQATRGTTHISVMDQAGNIASLSASNGEGSGHVLADTGIMLNNMLGEQDLNPKGFHQWPPNRRMTSMMTPVIVQQPGGQRIAMGSGGSNRLRTAILQVLVNLIDFGMSLKDAVNSHRIHYEDGLLNIETDSGLKQTKYLAEHHPSCKLWGERNLFFGGTHSVIQKEGQFDGIGDLRRGGVAIIV